jgi:Putative zinc-finger
MRPQVPTHPDDDRLLELAYGEVPASEARALRQHVDGCARCRKVLDGIAEVRTAFRSIPEQPAPEKGLESLLAYGEQAAARARSRRGGLRILALLSAATAFVVVWLMLPGPSPRSDSLVQASPTKPPDVLAQAEAPHEAVQGTRARDEADRAKDSKELLRRLASPKADPGARTEQFKEEQPSPGRQSAPEPLAKQKVSEKKLDAPKEQPKLAEAPAAFPAGREGEARSNASGNLSGGLGSAGGKAGSAVGPPPASGAEGLASKSAAGAEKKRSAGARPEDGALGAVAKAPSSPPAALATTPPAGTSGDDLGGLQTAGKVAVAPRAETGASEDKAAAVADAVSAPAASPPAKAARPVPPMQSVRVGAGSPEKQARLSEIRRQLETARGDQRKALLVEKCEIEASLELRTDAVLTCSMVSREFPGTPEAKRASDLARGFSVQLPTGSER